jgi:hypothetical protein
VRVATQVADELRGDSRHNFAVLSSLPLARRVPVGSNATDVTASLCPVRVSTQNADELLGDSPHNFTVLSSLPIARRRAVG